MPKFQASVSVCRAGEWFQGGWGGAPPAAGGGGRLFGRWWLAAQGVEVEDELQALDFVSNGCKID